jgi:hypothetical protein
MQVVLYTQDGLRNQNYRSEARYCASIDFQKNQFRSYQQLSTVISRKHLRRLFV